MPLDRMKNHVKFLLDNGKVHDALRVYTNTCSDILKKECLEIFIEGLAAIARENYIDNKFSFDSFLCWRCNEVIKDPVTLKCGHTFSKKCALAETKSDIFTCPRCGKNYSFAYLSQLKNSVTILSLVDRLYDRLAKYKNTSRASSEDYAVKLSDASRYLLSSCGNDLLSEDLPPSLILHDTAALAYCKKESIRWNFGNYREAFKALLTCFTLDSNNLHAKFSSIEVFCKILQNYPSSFTHSSHSISIDNTKHLTRNSLGCSSGSSDSLHAVEDERSSDEEETKVMSSYSDRKDLHIMVDSFFEKIKKIGDEKSILSRIDIKYFDKKEFECPLCMRLLWEPVTTTCGHTFCRVCLNRCFDHQPTCPLCKTSLACFLAERVQSTTELLEHAIKNVFPVEYGERQAIYLEEMEELSNAGKDPEHEIPLFVCTVALPTVPCPLHVFEPRYRLMIRQCMESGSRQFGMCGVVDDEIAEYGTMLEIRDVQYFSDGRSIVDTIGRKRFRILRRGERDGYHTGAVEFLEDQPLSDLDLQNIEEKHDETYKISKAWFTQLPTDTRHRILQHFGPMPHVETDYVSSPDGPSWLWWMLAILPVENRLKVLLISLTSLHRRLEFLYRILLHFQSSILS